jgi:hypothetical protein
MPRLLRLRQNLLNHKLQQRRLLGRVVRAKRVKVEGVTNRDMVAIEVSACIKIKAAAAAVADETGGARMEVFAIGARAVVREGKVKTVTAIVMAVDRAANLAEAIIVK